MIQAEVENRIRQLNPWLIYPDKSESLIRRFIPQVYVSREIEKKLLPADRAVLIVGPRQAGKSTMVWNQLLGYSPNVLFLNMEDPLLRMGCADPIDLIGLLRSEYSFVRALFIDEIQHLEQAGLFVKGLADSHSDIRIWVTGSSSFHLRSKTRESLAGRAIRKQILPFSVRELLSHAAPANTIAERHICEHIVAHQLIFGSYPSAYLTDGHNEKIMILSDLVEALILRDASDLFRIRRIDAFRKLLTLLAGQIGNLVNFSELASICNADVGTVSSYIEILEESHIVKKVLPFAQGKRREITGSPKVFFTDNGIRNQLLNQFSTQIDLRTDKGQLFENWAFTEIHKALPFQSSLHFWRSKSEAEVDFVIGHAGKIYGLEVKSGASGRMNLSRSARSFIEAYHPEKFAVLNMTLEQSSDMNISFVTPYSLSRWLDEIFSA